MGAGRNAGSAPPDSTCGAASRSPPAFGQPEVPARPAALAQRAPSGGTRTSRKGLAGDLGSGSQSQFVSVPVPKEQEENPGTV